VQGAPVKVRVGRGREVWGWEGVQVERGVGRGVEEPGRRLQQQHGANSGRMSAGLL
jgi:hypothetical protein